MLSPPFPVRPCPAAVRKKTRRVRARGNPPDKTTDARTTERPKLPPPPKRTRRFPIRRRFRQILRAAPVQNRARRPDSHSRHSHGDFYGSAQRLFRLFALRQPVGHAAALRLPTGAGVPFGVAAVVSGRGRGAQGATQRPDGRRSRSLPTNSPTATAFSSA